MTEALGFFVLWCGVLFALFFWAQRIWTSYVGRQRPDVRGTRRNRLVRDPGLTAPFGMIILSLSALATLRATSPHPTEENERRRAVIALGITLTWLLLGFIPLGAAYALVSGLGGTINGQSFGHWDYAFVLIYSLAVMAGIASFYRQRGYVTRAWWRLRIVGAAAGLVVLVLYFWP